jgi:hypothetical protein
LRGEIEWIASHSYRPRRSLRFSLSADKKAIKALKKKNATIREKAAATKMNAAPKKSRFKYFCPPC